MEKTSRIIGQLKKQKLDGVLISSVHNIIYLTGFSSFSIEEREAFLIITPNAQYIITDPRYSEAVRNQVKDFKLLETSYQTPFKTHLENLVKKHQLKTLGTEEDNLTVAEAKRFKKYFNLKSFDTSNLRKIKTAEEIKKIKKACEIGDKAFKHILGQIKVGVTEKQIALELEDFFRKNGADKSFETIVAFGKNSSVPHHQTGETKLLKKEGQFVLLDFGVKYQNYCSDMTRTIFFGKASEKQKKIYQTVLKAQQEASAVIKKGVKASKVGEAADQVITSQDYPSIPHGLGHGVGLEIHESPTLSPKSEDILVPGMVFSIEPGIYLAGFGGVRIEDLFTIEGGKLRSLTNAPQELIEL